MADAVQHSGLMIALQTMHFSGMCGDKRTIDACFLPPMRIALNRNYFHLHRLLHKKHWG